MAYNHSNGRQDDTRGLQIATGSILPSPVTSTLSDYFQTLSTKAGGIASAAGKIGMSSVATFMGNGGQRGQKEQVLWAGFDTLQWTRQVSHKVLILTYPLGFQLWDVQEASNVRELVSRRDGPITCLRLVPYPAGLPLEQSEEPSPAQQASHPLLAVASNSPEQVEDGPLLPAGKSTSSVVKFYSLQSHSYVHVLRFRTAVVALRCNSRIIAVALPTQIYCFSTKTLKNVFSVLTYPTPVPHPSLSPTPVSQVGPLALGPRWLAYAANQPMVASTGRASPQALTPSPGPSLGSSPVNARLMAHYARESSRQLASGIMTLGEMGIRRMSKFFSEGTSPGAGDGSSGGSSPRSVPGHRVGKDADQDGMVMVRDVVTRTVIAHFRAHSSPVSALAFDPAGTLLLTTSVTGHSINVYQIGPRLPAGMLSQQPSSHVHLYKLHRGVTSAVIHELAFSSDSRWVAATTNRGTTHVFAINPFGGPVTPDTHVSPNHDTPTPNPTPGLAPTPWWTPRGLLQLSPSPSPHPPAVVSLSVVSRIKHSNAGWTGGIAGVAAAASGKGTPAPGPVSVMFHNGGQVAVNGMRSTSSGSFSSDPNQFTVWMFTPAGFLVRYRLRAHAWGEGGDTGVHPQGVGSIPRLKLQVMPLERWDVGRRSGWDEREDSLEGVLADTDVAGIGYGGLEEQRGYLLNAEIGHAGYGRQQLLWCRPNFHFHVFAGAHDGESSGSSESSSRGTDLEKVQTWPVEIRMRELATFFLDADTHSQPTRNGLILPAGEVPQWPARGRQVVSGALVFPKVDSSDSESVDSSNLIVANGMVYKRGGIEPNRSTMEPGVALAKGPGPTGQVAPVPFFAGEDVIIDGNCSSGSEKTSEVNTPASSFESTPTLLLGRMSKLPTNRNHASWQDNSLRPRHSTATPPSFPETSQYQNLHSSSSLSGRNRKVPEHDGIGGSGNTSQNRPADVDKSAARVVETPWGYGGVPAKTGSESDSPVASKGEDIFVEKDDDFHSGSLDDRLASNTHSLDGWEGGGMFGLDVDEV